MSHRHFGNPMDAARFAEASEHQTPNDARHPVALLDVLVIGGTLVAAIASLVIFLSLGNP